MWHAPNPRAPIPIGQLPAAGDNYSRGAAPAAYNERRIHFSREAPPWEADFREARDRGYGYEGRGQRDARFDVAPREAGSGLPSASGL